MTDTVSIESQHCDYIWSTVMIVVFVFRITSLGYSCFLHDEDFWNQALPEVSFVILEGLCLVIFTEIALSVFAKPHYYCF